MQPTHEIIKDTEGFARLQPEWNELLEQSDRPSPFLSWAWQHTWWRRYGEGDRGVSLQIVTERRDGRLTAVLPGYVRLGGTLTPTTYAFLGTQFESTDYLRPIVHPGTEAAVLPGLLDFLLEREPAIDRIELLNILEDDPVLPALAAYARSAGASFETEHHRVCPFIDLDASADWETFLASRSSNMRAKVRRFMRRVADAGAEFGWVEERAQVRGAVAELFALHAKRFEAKDTESIFKAELRQPFHEDVSELFLDAGILRLFQLRADGHTVAALYCFEFGGGLYYFQAGIDPAWEAENVGLVIMAHVIKYAFDAKLHLFDFMRGAEPYKFRWTDTRRNMVVARLGVSAKGRALLSLQQGVSAAKSVVKRFVRPSPTEPVGPGASS